jgi:ribosomal protein S5
VRSVLELAGYTNMLSKIVGTNNVLNNALLAIDMVSKYKNFTIRFKEKVKELDAEPAETTESAE